VLIASKGGGQNRMLYTAHEGNRLMRRTTVTRTEMQQQIGSKIENIMS
jgi:hypothetical protein